MSRHDAVSAYFDRLRIADLLQELLCELGAKAPEDPYSCIEEWAARKRREVAGRAAPPMAVTRPEGKFASSLLVGRRWKALVSGLDVPRDAFVDAFRGCLARCVVSPRVRAEPVDVFSIDPGSQSSQSPGVLNSPVGLPSCGDGDSLSILLGGNPKETLNLPDVQRLSLVDVVICCVSSGSEEECAALQASIFRFAPMCGVRGFLFWSAFALSGSARARIEASVVARDPDTGAMLDVAFLDGSVQRVLESQWHRVPREMARSKSLSSAVVVDTLPLRCVVLCCNDFELTCGEHLTAVYCGEAIAVTVASIDVTFADRNPSRVVRQLPSRVGGQLGAVLTLAQRATQDPPPPVQFSDVALLDSEVVGLVRMDALHSSVDAVFKAHWTRSFSDERAATASTH